MATQLENQLIHFGFAFCSPRDNFNKKTGRALASERLILHRLTIPIKGSPEETKKFVLRLLIDRKFDRLRRKAVFYPEGLSKQTPGWLRKWARDLQNKGALCLKAANPIPF